MYKSFNWDIKNIPRSIYNIIFLWVQDIPHDYKVIMTNVAIVKKFLRTFFNWTINVSLDVSER